MTNQDYICKFNLILLVLVLFASISCNGRDGEVEFKRLAIQLSDMRNSYLRIETKTKKTYSEENRNIFVSVEAQKKELFFNKNKEKWLNLLYAFKMFSSLNYNSIWMDDAAFCRAVGLIFVREKSNILINEKIESISDFLNNYSGFHLEEWTQEHFFREYKILTDGNFLHKISEEKAIRYGLYQIIITEYCLLSDFKKAENILEKLRLESFPAFHIEKAKGIINFYQKSN